jgi:hypothetical protein
VLEARLARCAAVLLALLLGSSTPGCAAMSPVGLGAAERSRLSEAPVIHSVHYQPIRRLRVVTVALDDATGWGGWIDLEDPVAIIEAGFLAGLRRELGLTNIEVFDRSLPSDHVPAIPVDPEILRVVFHDGLVLDFESTAWRLGFVSRNFLDPAKTTYGLDFVVRVRLIRLPGKEVLWQDFCAWTNEEAHRPLKEVMTEGGAALKALRAEIAATCTRELLGLLLGREARTTWYYRTVPVAR